MLPDPPHSRDTILMRLPLRLSWHLLFFSILFPLGAAAQKHPGPEIVFGAGTVTVAGVVPGADVYLFGVSREAMGYYNQIVPREAILHDSNKSGRVDYMVGRAVAPRSIWFAVDLKSGLAIAGSPPNYPSRLIGLDDRHLKKDVNGDVASLSYEGMVAEIVVVRPGIGIWGGSVGLRGKNDESKNGPNNGASSEHRPVISVAHLEPRAATTAPAPSKLKNGDVVFMMNSYTAEYSFIVLGGQQ